MIGTLLQNRYRLDAELGTGGMGTIYRASDTLLQREVAVKVLSAPALGTEGRARLLREAQAVARLNHPNIVSLYDAGESTAPFLVMELVAGDSLRDRRNRWKRRWTSPASCAARSIIPTRMAWCIATPKPENVLITPEAWRNSSTSGWPARAPPAPPSKAHWSARCSISRQNKRWARRSMRAPTCMRWG
jgi:serine/threonine protein kinase